MKILEEYKKSLKEVGAEDRLDIYLYRPLAFIIVKLFYSFPLTPNHYSLLSLTSGTIAGLFFSRGTLNSLKIGALFFLLSTILDNCNGMIARLKNNGTEFGRLVDGVVDYLVNVIVYFSLGIGLSKMYPNNTIAIWIILIISGFSKIIHSIIYDHYLNEYLSHKNNSNNFLIDEIRKIRTKINHSEVVRVSPLRLIALKAYLNYSLIQAGFRDKELDYNSPKYCKNNLGNLKLWSLIGPTSHNTILIISNLLGFPFLLFGFSIIFGNLWFLIMTYMQHKTNKTLYELNDGQVQL